MPENKGLNDSRVPGSCRVFALSPAEQLGVTSMKVHRRLNPDDEVSTLLMNGVGTKLHPSDLTGQTLLSDSSGQSLLM